MNIDTDKIDDAVLALLWLTLHDSRRAWIGHDWNAMDRLYKKGMIDNPTGKAKSVALIDEGLARADLDAPQSDMSFAHLLVRNSAKSSIRSGADDAVRGMGEHDPTQL